MMGLMMQIALMLFAGITLLVLGLVRKSKVLKIIGAVLILMALAIAAMLFLIAVLLPAM
jgi:hypothetical protein